MTSFAKVIASNYKKYKERSLKNRFFKHKDIVPLIQNLGDKKACKVKEIGKSLEQRSIFSIKIGRGKVKVLLWSQMHGNEPTATGAIFDILNFLVANDAQNKYRQKILDKLTLYFVPMLNPDGAERFTRENAQGIDINRDAIALSSPEGKILKQIRNQIDAEYAFNLHDQETHYAAGNSNQPATISFLASLYNAQKTIDERRKKAMRTIVVMNKALQTEIPDRVARYYDDFLPNAFGDNIAKSGSSVILVESGGYSSKDIEKQEVRRLNCICILAGLESIASRENLRENYNEYFQIPINKRDKFFDILIRNVRLKSNNYEYSADIGMLSELEFSTNDNCFANILKIKKIGDLKSCCGHTDIDANNLRFETNKSEQDEPTRATLNTEADFVLINDWNEVVYKINKGKIRSVF